MYTLTVQVPLKENPQVLISSFQKQKHVYIIHQTKLLRVLMQIGYSMLYQWRVTWNHFKRPIKRERNSLQVHCKKSNALNFLITIYLLPVINQTWPGIFRKHIMKGKLGCLSHSVCVVCVNCSIIDRILSVSTVV